MYISTYIQIILEYLINDILYMYILPMIEISILIQIVSTSNQFFFFCCERFRIKI